MQRALRPAVLLTNVEWPGASVDDLAPSALAQPRGHGARQAPSGSGGAAGRDRRGIRCIGERMVVSALLRDAGPRAKRSARLHFRDAYGRTATQDLAVMELPAGRRVHAAVGRALIEDSMKRWLVCSTPEQRSAIELRVASLSTSLQLLSKYASFVAVDRSAALVQPSGPGGAATISANAPLRVMAITEDLERAREAAEFRARYEARAVQLRAERGLAGGSAEGLLQLVCEDAWRAQRGEAAGGGASGRAEELWENAMAISQTELATSHPVRLKVAMDYAAFLYEAGRPDEACRVSREAFEDAIFRARQRL